MTRVFLCFTLVALLATSAVANTTSTVANTCTCLAFADAAGICPKTNAFPAFETATASQKEIIYQDKAGTIRPATIAPGNCCQFSSPTVTEDGNHPVCRGDNFTCPDQKFTDVALYGSGTYKNAAVCSKEKAAHTPGTPDTTGGDTYSEYGCLCMTAAEVQEGAEAAGSALMTNIIMGVLAFIFAVIYAIWWFRCSCFKGKKKDPQGKQTEEQQGPYNCFWDCCDYTKHCCGYCIPVVAAIICCVCFLPKRGCQCVFPKWCADKPTALVEQTGPERL